MDPTQLLRSASVRGWSLGGGWGRKPNNDVSQKCNKGQRRVKSCLFTCPFSGYCWLSERWVVFLSSVQTSGFSAKRLNRLKRLRKASVQSSVVFRLY